MNAVVCAQLTFQMLTLLQDYLLHIFIKKTRSPIFGYIYDR